MIDLGRACARYRGTLVDFVDRHELRPETGAALAHLDRCARCTEFVESTILTITALRRMGDDASDAEPPADAWPRLRIRIQGWRRRPALMSPLAGLAMSFAIVAVLVSPVRFGGESLLGEVAAPTDVPDGAVSPIERQIEISYIANVRRVAPSGPEAADASAPGELIRIYPDDRRPIRKEVGPSPTTVRPSEAS